MSSGFLYLLDNMYSICRPPSMSYILFSVQAPLMTHDFCLCSMCCRPFRCFFFSREPLLVRTTLLLSVLRFHASWPVFQYTSLACLSTVYLTSSGQVFCMSIILPSSSLNTCQLGSDISKSFMSHKTAPAAPISFPRDAASQMCLLHASLMSSSHCPVHTACAQKIVVALLIADFQEERQQNRWLLSRRASQLSSQYFSLRRHDAKGLGAPHSPGTAPTLKTLFVPFLMCTCPHSFVYTLGTSTIAICIRILNHSKVAVMVCVEERSPSEPEIPTEYS